jgi:hypothetical protein
MNNERLTCPHCRMVQPYGATHCTTTGMGYFGKPLLHAVPFRSTFGKVGRSKQAPDRSFKIPQIIPITWGGER